MTRESYFALLLFVLVTVSGWLVLIAHRHRTEQATNRSSTTWSLLLEASNELLRQDLEVIQSTTDDRTRSAGHLRFRPVSRAIEVQCHAAREFGDALISSGPLPPSQLLAYRAATESRFAALLREQASALSVNQRDTAELLAAQRQRGEQLLAESRRITAEPTGDLRSAALHNALLRYTLTTVSHWASMTSGRDLICTHYFPVVQTDRCHYRVGDTLRATIGVGTYQADFFESHSAIYVDGELLPLGPDGTAQLVRPVRERGERSLRTEVRVTNPLTGMVNTGEGTFTYEAQ